jgi:hypothetical protein
MEQRPLRLGNLVDDYCPRERRVTNHVIVAIIDDEIRQTRCSTCEAEHAYRAAQVPRRRKKEGATELYDEVLASVAGSQLVAPRAAEPEPPGDEAAEPLVNGTSPSHPTSHKPPVSDLAARAAEAAPDSSGDVVDDRPDDAFPANRQLIRATLPRTENAQPVPRPIPEFTMHQRQSRGGQGFRHGQGWQGQGGNDGGRSNGFRSGRPGGGQGPGQGQRQGQGRGPGHGRPGQGGGQPDGNRGGQGKGRRSR